TGPIVGGRTGPVGRPSADVRPGELIDGGRFGPAGLRLTPRVRRRPPLVGRPSREAMTCGRTISRRWPAGAARHCLESPLARVIASGTAVDRRPARRTATQIRHQAIGAPTP